MSATSKIPASHDALFIKREAGITNHFGYGPDPLDPSQQILVYPTDVYDAVEAVLSDYEARYLGKVRIPAALELITALRREKMQQITLGAFSLTLDTTTEAHLASAVLGLQRNPLVETIDWEASPGVFVPLTREQVFTLGDAAFLHVQSCFSYARSLSNLVRSCTTIEELEAVDVEAGWPNS